MVMFVQLPHQLIQLYLAVNNSNPRQQHGGKEGIDMSRKEDISRLVLSIPKIQFSFSLRSSLKQHNPTQYTNFKSVDINRLDICNICMSYFTLLLYERHFKA